MKTKSSSFVLDEFGFLVVALVVAKTRSSEADTECDVENSKIGLVVWDVIDTDVVVWLYASPFDDAQ